MLRGMDSSHLDRKAVGKLFGVGEPPRPAIDGRPARNSRWQRRRHRAAGAGRADGKTAASGKCSAAAASPMRLDRTHREPAAILLTPGGLWTEFRCAEDLAAHLLELSQAMVNDWSAFILAVEECPAPYDESTN